MNAEDARILQDGIDTINSILSKVPGVTGLVLKVALPHRILVSLVLINIYPTKFIHVKK